jgi:hypothetical protein
MFTYTVTATSKDGFTATASVSYTVTETAPQNTAPPQITGTAAAGKTLTCPTGTWSGDPSGFTYQWSRDGTPLVGATSSTYTVQRLDEGSTLTCTVTASNSKGSATATSAAIKVPVPHVAHCPAATGKLAGGTIGPLRLQMTRAQARRAFPKSSDRGKRYEDFFCLTPIGVRAGYASPKLLRRLARTQAARYRGRVIWASSSNPYYDIDGIRAGATLKAAQARLPHGHLLTVGRNDWYLAPAGSVTGVLKVRKGIVQEVGIGTRQLTRTLAQQRIFMTSFE